MQTYFYSQSKFTGDAVSQSKWPVYDVLDLLTQCQGHLAISYPPRLLLYSAPVYNNAVCVEVHNRTYKYLSDLT